MTRATLLLSILLLSLPPFAALADEMEQAHRYADCLNLARSSPQDGFEKAMEWRDQGGGGPAKHCVALALISLKFPTEGAERLEELAQEVNAKPAFKAKLMAQAGQAWLMAGQPQRAQAAQTAGLKLDPNSAALYVDRAQSFVAEKAYFEAVDDLNKALEIDPTLTDAWIFRATAYRYLDSLELAEQDIRQALILAPDHPDALLEEGILERLKGNNSRAREAWMRLLELAPNSKAAPVARTNLEKMDVNKDK